MSEYTCEKCGKIFESDDGFEASFARNEHQSWCVLPVKYKVLKFCLAPFVCVAIPVLFVAFMIYGIGAMVMYPFGLVMELVLDNKVTGWHEYLQWVGIEDKNKVVRVKRAK